MKTTSIIFALFFISLTLWAQQEGNNNEEIKTIFKSGSHSNGGYGGLMVNYSEIGNRDALLVGAKGGWVINHSFTLGLGGYGFMTEPLYDPLLSDRYEFAGGYGGLLLEPIIGGKQPVHVSFPVIIGAGGIAYNKHYSYDENVNTEIYEDSDAFFVVEPGIEIEFNIVKFMRFALAGSYRYTSNIGLKYQTDGLGEQSIGTKDLLNGWNVGLVVKFGKF